MNPTKTSLRTADSKAGREFEKLVKWASAFSIAILAGFLGSLKQINPVIQIQFSVVSVVAFLAGGIVTLILFRAILSGDNRRRALLVVGAVVFILLGFFLVGIRNVSPESRTDVIIGTGIAIAVLSGVGWLLWQVGRFLESDEEQNNGGES